MIKSKDTPSKTPAEVELLGEERQRLGRVERQLIDSLTRDMTAGQVVFRGTIDDAPAGTIPQAAQKLMTDRLGVIYDRLDHFAAQISARDVMTVLRTDDLSTVAPALAEAGIGLVHLTPQGYQIATDTSPLDDLMKITQNEIRYGHVVTGALLATKLAEPPRGAPVEVVQALCAAAVRSGLLEVTYQGAKIGTPSDHRLDRVFGKLTDFRSASFAPPSAGPSVETRVALAAGLAKLTGTKPPIDTAGLAAALRSYFGPDSEACSGCHSRSTPGISAQRNVATVADRVALLRAAHGNHVLDRTLDAVSGQGEKELKRALGNADLLLVRSQELDSAGESGMLNAAWSQFNAVLDMLRNLVARLGQAGVRRIVITADHGFVTLSRALGPDRSIDPPAGGTGDLHRRGWVGKGASTTPSTLRVAVASTGVPSDLDLIVPRGLAVFRAGGSKQFFHGGLSPQELVIPVIVVDTEPARAPRELRVEVTVAGERITTGASKALGAAGRPFFIAATSMIRRCDDYLNPPSQILPRQGHQHRCPKSG